MVAWFDFLVLLCTIFLDAFWNYAMELKSFASVWGVCSDSNNFMYCDDSGYYQVKEGT